MVWIWNEQLRELGFRQKSRTYWQAAQRYGLSGNDHISAFLWCQHTPTPASGRRRGHPRDSPLVCYEWSEFHVTFEVAGHNLHFYYHELHPNQWYPGGRTSRREIERLGVNARQLRQRAHEVAEALVTRWGAEFNPRH